MFRIVAVLVSLLVCVNGPALADRSDNEDGMTIARMNDLIDAVGYTVTRPADGQWRFRIEGIPVFVVTDTRANRMRILVGITKTESIPETLFRRLMQANFDTTLDARYAIARDIVWAAYLHMFKSLSDAEFLSGIGQTVNLARTIGKTYSSGGIAYGGGDSSGIIERELIEKLLEKGLAI